MLQTLQTRFYTDWDFYRRVLAITLPIAIQNVINLGVNMMDIIMLGQLGDVAIASANLGGQLFTILDVVGFGLASGAAVLIAQYWGKRDMLRIRQISALSLRFALGASALFTVLGRLFPVQIMHIFATDADVIREGAAYLEWLSVSFVFYSFSNCYIMCLRAVEQVKVSIAVYSSSFFVNVFFNYCFIFGKLGAPELGVRGAALGTIMARLFECAAVLVYMYRIERTVCFTPKWLLRFRSGLFSDYVRNSVPVVSNELLWALGVAVTNLTIGHMGPSFTSAVSIVNVVNNLVSVFIFGMANATAVVVGKTIGEGRQQHGGGERCAQPCGHGPAAGGPAAHHEPLQREPAGPRHRPHPDDHSGGHPALPGGGHRDGGGRAAGRRRRAHQPHSGQRPALGAGHPAGPFGGLCVPLVRAGGVLLFAVRQHRQEHPGLHPPLQRALGAGGHPRRRGAGGVRFPR